MSELCQEQKYVKLGRWGEWRACEKQAKHEIVATVWGRGFGVGDTIHVCGIHKRKHEQKTAREDRWKRDREASEERHHAARDRVRRLGCGQPQYGRDFKGGYTGGVVLSAPEVDALLLELGR